jgi:hypothetical protein
MSNEPSNLLYGSKQLSSALTETDKKIVLWSSLPNVVKDELIEYAAGEYDFNLKNSCPETMVNSVEIVEDEDKQSKTFILEIADEKDCSLSHQVRLTFF